MSKSTFHPCRACGKMFRVYPSEVATKTSGYCSRSCKWPSQAARFWSHVDKNGPIPLHMPHLGQCWVWTAAIHDRGYGVFNPEGLTTRAHRYSWKLHYGATDLKVLHRCDNRICVRPEHLFVGTNKDNTDDCKAKGRFPTNEQHWKCKLTNAQVAAIRDDARDAATVAVAFGVSVGHVQVLRRMKSRTHPVF